MTFKKALFSILLININLFSQEKKYKEIAIIFEGLPMDGIDMSGQDILTLNYNITELLKMLKIPSVGFINEMKIAEPNDTNLERRKVILDFWVKNNLTLGNFTYKKLDPNKVTFKEYKEDIEKGEKISAVFLEKVNKRLIYFRSPYENEIKDKDKKNEILHFLKSKNYIVLPKTMDNDDEIFNVCYLNSRVKDDSLIYNYVVNKYLNHTKNMIEYYENLAIKINNNVFPQILSLKLNLINIDLLPYIISLIQDKGYKVTTINSVLNSSVYINLSEEEKMLNFWENLSKFPIPPKPKIPIVIDTFYKQLTKQNYILE